MSKEKTKGKQIELRFHGKTSLLDEIVAENASIHVEQMSDESFWMSIETEKESVSFNFFLAKNEITDEEGETYRPIVLKVQEKHRKK